jgi:imidazolonepropionase-like amidohydrolase
MGSSAGLGLKSAVEEGSIKGPRVITSDRQIAQVAGHGDFPFLPYKLVRKDGSFRTTIVSGEEDCREEVRKRVRKGADLIKVMLTPGVAIGSKDRTKYYFSDKELDALIDEAHRYNIPVACHCIGEEGIHRAVQYGVQTIEHGAGLSKEDAEKMKANDIVLVSTLSIFNRFVEEGDKTEIKKENLLEAGRVREKHIDSIRLAYQQEVPIALGTDSIGDNLAPHGENALELELYVNEIGMTEMDAIKAGTTVAAMALNREDIGSIERGKRADLLILNSNPLDDIENIYDVCQVYKDGEPCL